MGTDGDRCCATGEAARSDGFDYNLKP